MTDVQKEDLKKAEKQILEAMATIQKVKDNLEQPDDEDDEEEEVEDLDAKLETIIDNLDTAQTDLADTINA